MLAEGVLWGGFHNVSYSHGEAEVQAVIGAYDKVLPKLADALARGTVESSLEGKMLEPVFRRTENFNLKPKAPAAQPAASTEARR